MGEPAKLSIPVGARVKETLAGRRGVVIGHNMPDGDRSFVPAYKVRWDPHPVDEDVGETLVSWRYLRETEGEGA